MDPGKFAVDALHREAQARAAERQMAEEISRRLSHEKAVQAANLQREQMRRWQEEARRGR
jgi:hypothetical protein